MKRWEARVFLLAELIARRDVQAGLGAPQKLTTKMELTTRATWGLGEGGRETQPQCVEIS